MNVQLLPAALEDIAVLRAAGYRGTGFLLGTEMGRFALVERLLPHVEAYYRAWDAPELAPYTIYNSRR